MEKIVLKDGTELTAEIWQTQERFSLRTTGKTLQELEPLLTKENLTRIELQTEEGEAYGIYKNLTLFSITKFATEEVEAVLEKEDNITARLVALEEGQNLQDGAIVELAGLIGGAE